MTKYYGEVAANYDASRSRKPKWQRELDAVDRFVTRGPVLDAPFGTGRFVPIYRAKGLKFSGIDISPDMLKLAHAKHGDDMDTVCCSIFDMPPFEGYQTAVCVRFLEWLPIYTTAIVIEILRRIADTLVLTINHGVEGQPEAYTYDFGKFLIAIDGLLIEDRAVTADVRGITSEMFKLRPANWGDVIAQFKPDFGDFARRNIQRIADKHAAFAGLQPMIVNEKTMATRCEYWTMDKLKSVLDVLVMSDRRFLTDSIPRSVEGPLTVIERNGKMLLIDGRKRANFLDAKRGPLPVLVMRPR